ncbi:MAG: hypothetical protein ABI165_00815 [Bryobacteraceae bacterium]
MEWAIPKGVYEALDAEFRFDFDLCPLGGSNDGLSRLFTEWRGRLGMARLLLLLQISAASE